MAFCVNSRNCSVEGAAQTLPTRIGPDIFRQFDQAIVEREPGVLLHQIAYLRP